MVHAKTFEKNFRVLYAWFVGFVVSRSMTSNFKCKYVTDVPKIP